MNLYDETKKIEKLNNRAKTLMKVMHLTSIKLHKPIYFGESKCTYMNDNRCTFYSSKIDFQFEHGSKVNIVVKIRF